MKQFILLLIFLIGGFTASAATVGPPYYTMNGSSGMYTESGFFYLKSADGFTTTAYVFNKRSATLNPMLIRPYTGWTYGGSGSSVIPLTAGSWTFGGITFDRRGVAVTIGGYPNEFYGTALAISSSTQPVVIQRIVWNNGGAESPPSYNTPGVLYTVNYTVQNNTTISQNWQWIPEQGTPTSGASGTINYMGTRGNNVLIGYALVGTLIPIPTGWIDPDEAIHEPMIVAAPTQANPNINTWARTIQKIENSPANGEKQIRVHTTNTSLSNQTLIIKIGAISWTRFIPGFQVGQGQDFYEFTIPADIVGMLSTESQITFENVANSSYPVQTFCYKFSGNQFTDTSVPFEGWVCMYPPDLPPTFTDPETEETTTPGGKPLPPSEEPPEIIPPNQVDPIIPPNPPPNPNPPITPPNPIPGVITPPGGGGGTFPGQTHDPNPANIAQGVYDALQKSGLEGNFESDGTMEADGETTTAIDDAKGSMPGVSDLEGLKDKMPSVPTMPVLGEKDYTISMPLYNGHTVTTISYDMSPYSLYIMLVRYFILMCLSLGWAMLVIRLIRGAFADAG